MMTYSLLSEYYARETNIRTEGPVQHKMWYILVGKVFYYVSWLSMAPDSDQPECMTFVCDEHGDVKDWGECASSCAADPKIALSEILEQLLYDDAA